MIVGEVGKCGSNVDFIRHEKACEPDDATVYIAQTRRARVVSPVRKLSNNDLEPKL